MTEDQRFALELAAENQRFWWNFALQVLVAVATLLAVWAALFGRWFQGKYLPPKLRLWINDPQGDRQISGYNDGGAAETIWCHIRVSNDQRSSPASRVEVRLMQIEVEDDAGNLSVHWRGEALMHWRSEIRLKRSDITIGADHDCDLFALSKRGFVQIATKTTDPFVFHQKCHVVMTLRAFSLEGESAPVRVKINWDGGWPIGSPDPEKQLQFFVLPAL